MLLPLCVVPVRGLLQKQANHFSAPPPLPKGTVRGALPTAAPAVSRVTRSLVFSACFVFSVQNTLRGSCQQQVLDVEALALSAWASVCWPLP